MRERSAYLLGQVMLFASLTLPLSGQAQTHELKDDGLLIY